MKIFSIALKEIKHNLRNRSVMIIMIIFPLALMWILGNAFSNSMGDSPIDLSDVKVIYSVKDEGELSKGFETFKENISDLKIEFNKIENREEGIKSIENLEFAAYIVIDNDNKELKVYKNEKFAAKVAFIEGILETFVQKYNVIYEISKVNPQAIQSIMNNQEETNCVNIQSIDEERQPRAIDFYGITMLTLIIMYSMLTGGYAIISEETRKTKNRIFVTPIKKHEIFIGKVLGTVSITIIQMFIVIAFSTKVLGVYWGNNIGTILLIVASQIIMSISVGIGVGLLVKNEGAMNGIIQAIIPALIFLGGGYMPLEQFGSDTLMNIAKISPVRWINDAIFNLIYQNDFQYVSIAIIINMSIAAIFLAIASLKFTRKEAV